jgi:hypothetical protein
MKPSIYDRDDYKKKRPLQCRSDPRAISQPMEGNTQGTLQDLPASTYITIINIGDMFK